MYETHKRPFKVQLRSAKFYYYYGRYCSVLSKLYVLNEVSVLLMKRLKQ